MALTSKGPKGCLDLDKIKVKMFSRDFNIVKFIFRIRVMPLVSSGGGFLDYVFGTLGIALWLLPVLAWYDVFRTWSKDWMDGADTTRSKLVFAIAVTIVVFLIIALFRGLTPRTDTVVVTPSAMA